MVYVVLFSSIYKVIFALFSLLMALLISYIRIVFIIILHAPTELYDSCCACAIPVVEIMRCHSGELYVESIVAWLLMS